MADRVKPPKQDFTLEILNRTPRTAASYQAFDGARRAQEILELWQSPTVKDAMDKAATDSVQSVYGQ